MKNLNLILNGKWKYFADKESKFTFDEAAGLYRSKKIKDIMNVPSNWQREGLNNFSGTVWFFKEFDSPTILLNLQVLEFSGVDYFTDVWLNNNFVGTHEGYFQKFFFDISGLLKPYKNLLTVKVTSPLEQPGTVWPLKKKLIKGIFNHHDCRPGGWSYKHGQDRNTGGIWNDIKILNLKNLYPSNIKITSQLNSNYSKADIIVDITCYSSNELKFAKDNIKLRLLSPSGKTKSTDFSLQQDSKSDSLFLFFEIDNPELWWSWDTGRQNLYTLYLSLDNVDVIESFGIREIKLDEKTKIFFLNGKKLFLRGTNIIPSQFLSDLTHEKIKSQVKLIKDANVNIIRMHAHVNRKEYYDQCDREGILVWQDFALQWTYDDSPDFILNAANQIEEMVLLHYNHPSIAFWCCHNEPGKQIETLDPHLYDAVAQNDSSRIIRMSSNYEEHPYDGWYWGNKEHFAECPMGPLVTEFGAQALPEYKSLRKFLTSTEIKKPDWAKWKYHNFQYEQTFHIAGVKQGKDIKEFIRNSQDYQAELISTAIDFYRRQKFIKVTALFQFMFIDCWESISWSVVDYYGIKKAGFHSLKRAFQPLYISIKVMRKKYFSGQNLNINFWIINDLLNNYTDCRIDFILNMKTLASLQVPLITENSVTQYHWENLAVQLPVRIPSGEHRVIMVLKDRKEKIISTNIFNIEIEKKPKLLDE
jgi:beta-mannosidase